MQEMKCYAQSYSWKSQTRPGFLTLKIVSKMTMCLTRRNTQGRRLQYRFQLLNYQPKYNSHRNSKSNGVSNQLILAKRRKTGDNEGDGRQKEQRPRRNLDYIPCKFCGEKGHSDGNNYFPNQARLKEDAEALIKMKQEKSPNKHPGGGDQKALVNVKNASCSLMIGSTTNEWGELPSPGLMFCQTSTQEAR